MWTDSFGILWNESLQPGGDATAVLQNAIHHGSEAHNVKWRVFDTMSLNGHGLPTRIE